MTPELHPVHQSGSGPRQQNQIVLPSAEKHGRITRRDVSELFRITLPQACRLLDLLVEEGLVVRESGAGRGVGYRKPAK